ncbi:MAG: proton-conducting transporter membrane subunit, partial [Candidatus Micrarchaeales archaeon]
MIPVDFFVIGYLMIIALSLLLVSGIASFVHRQRKLQLIISTGLFTVVAVTSIALLLYAQDTQLLNLFNIYPFSMLFVALFSVAFMLINILSYDYSDDYLSFSLLLGFVALGTFSVAMANSFITILLGIELVSVPTAFMIMINGKQYVEAAVKLFILAAIGITLIAFAIALIFPYDPGLYLVPLLSTPGLSGSYLTTLALLLFIAGLAFDASLFPFNLWVPDVYSGSPANITALLAGINKKVAFVALFEILFLSLFQFIGIFSLVFQVLAIFTMFFGNIVALVQNNVKRLFAYSAISQAGYIALGFAAGTAYGISASIFQIVAHTFMIIGTFAIILWLESKNINTIQDYNGLGSRNKFMAFSLTIFMLSMIGIPPLIGFVGKTGNASGKYVQSHLHFEIRKDGEPVDPRA